jgi:hypothetical protein
LSALSCQIKTSKLGFDFIILISLSKIGLATEKKLEMAITRGVEKRDWLLIKPLIISGLISLESSRKISQSFF